MASIRKRGNCYGAQFRVPTSDGSWKLVSVSTDETDARAAQREANKLEQAALDAAGAGTAKGEEYCSILLNAIREAKAGHLTENKARGHLTRITEIARGKPIDTYTVRAWLAEYLTMKKPNVSESTFKAYSWAYNSFVEHLGDRADIPLETVEVSDIRHWRDTQKEAGLSDKRVNNLLQYLAGPFNKATRNGILDRNPVMAVEKLRIKDSVSRKPFTSEEVEKLFTACPSTEWQCALLLGAYCGMRLGDATRRLVGDFDLKKSTVAFLPQKKERTGQQITLPLHPAVHRIVAKLTKMKGARKEAFLMPTLAKTPIGGNTGLSLRFLEIMKDADVNRGESAEATGRGRTRYERSFHSTRHTAATWLANGGVSEDLRMLLTDHESKDVARRYTHQSIEQLRKALESMPNVGDAD